MLIIASVDKITTMTTASALVTIFTALHGMQTWSSDENSVRPSVCHTRDS